MPKKIAPVPKGYRTITPSLVVRGADGAVRRMRTRLSERRLRVFYAAQSCCHSERAAWRWSLKSVRLVRCLS
jgi:hypothetical protein